MGGKLSGFAHALYDPKKRQFLGRDGAGWGKLGVFYFFFYLGLAGFFCAMLAVFMALSPRDRPRYILDESRMRTRSNPLSPGLGFRPQPEVDKNLILIKKGARSNESNIYANNLDNYLQVYYWKNNEAADDDSQSDVRKFVINNPRDCTSTKKYGYSQGQPCVLVKMNKLVGFEPVPGSAPGEKQAYEAACDHNNNGVSVHCYGEYPADVDNIGSVTYISEKSVSQKCGSLGTDWFPYNGKSNRKDVYQAPYVWVQFTNPKPNILINVLCRIYGQNIDFEKKTGRALTRFQLYVEDLPKKSSRRSEF